jgi:hypothetical protein
MDADTTRLSAWLFLIGTTVYCWLYSIRDGVGGEPVLAHHWEIEMLPTIVQQNLLN